MQQRPPVRPAPLQRPGAAGAGMTRREMLRLGLLGGGALAALVSVGVLRNCAVPDAFPEPMDGDNQKRIGEFERIARGPMRTTLSRAYERSGEYRPYIDRIFEERGVPNALVDLAYPESSWKYRNDSPMGAEGLYQFMPDTARERGMVVDGAFDERCDPIVAAEAAADYLHQLHGRYTSTGDSWHWALTAYNYGMGNMAKYVEKADGEYAEYDDVLPHATASQRKRFAETRQYVAKFHGYRRALFSPDGIVREEGLQQRAALEFDSLRLAYPEKVYTARVRPGDALSLIAERYGVSMADIRRANTIQGDQLRAGQTLRIPVSDPLSLRQIADAADTELSSLLRMNHAVRTSAVDGGTDVPQGVRLHLPPNTARQVIRAHRQRLTDDARTFTAYRV